MGRQLATTNWTLILNAEATAPEVRQAAMAELCGAYDVQAPAGFRADLALLPLLPFPPTTLDHSERCFVRHDG